MMVLIFPMRRTFRFTFLAEKPHSPRFFEDFLQGNSSFQRQLLTIIIFRGKVDDSPLPASQFEADSSILRLKKQDFPVGLLPFLFAPSQTQGGRLIKKKFRDRRQLPGRTNHGEEVTWPILL